jgi:hypothetical protein
VGVDLDLGLDLGLAVDPSHADAAGALVAALTGLEALLAGAPLATRTALSRAPALCRLWLRLADANGAVRGRVAAVLGATVAALPLCPMQPPCGGGGGDDGVCTCPARTATATAPPPPAFVSHSALCARLAVDGAGGGGGVDAPLSTLPGALTQLAHFTLAADARSLDLAHGALSALGAALAASPAARAAVRVPLPCSAITVDVAELRAQGWLAGDDAGAARKKVRFKPEDVLVRI